MTNEWHPCEGVSALHLGLLNLQVSEVEQPVSVGVQALHQPLMKKSTFVAMPMDFILLQDFYSKD